MKKVVSAASTEFPKFDWQETDLHPAIEGAWLSEWYNEHYILEGTGLQPTVRPADSGDARFLPEVTIEVEVEDDTVYYKPSLKFPTLRYDDMDFWDSYGYWVGRWQSIATICSNMVRYPTPIGEDDWDWEDDEG